MLAVGKSPSWRENYDLSSEFFSRKFAGYWSTRPVGNGGCRVQFEANGAFRADSAKCTAWPSHWVLTPGPVTVTLRGQRMVANTRTSGTLVQVPPGTPRARSLVLPPCSSLGCSGRLQMTFYLDKPGDVTLGFGPGHDPHRTERMLRRERAAREREHFGQLLRELFRIEWTERDGAR